MDHHGHAPVAHSPRALLKAQIARLADMGYSPITATELEFFLFQGTHDDIARGGFKLQPISTYNEDYNIFQTKTKWTYWSPASIAEVIAWLAAALPPQPSTPVPPHKPSANTFFSAPGLQRPH